MFHKPSSELLGYPIIYGNPQLREYGYNMVINHLLSGMILLPIKESSLITYPSRMWALSHQNLVLSIVGFLASTGNSYHQKKMFEWLT